MRSLRPHGNAELGGDDYDGLIAEWLADDSLMNTEPETKQKILKLARQTKELLTSENSINVDEKIAGSIHIQKVIDRDHFSHLTEPLTKKH